MNERRYTIELIQSVPMAFRSAFARINNAFRVLQAIANARGAGGIRITKGDNGWIIDGSGVEGGGSLPAGYTFEEFTICVDGEPETRWWPTWTSNPDA